MIKNRVIGVLNCYTAEEHSFSDDGMSSPTSSEKKPGLLPLSAASAGTVEKFCKPRLLSSGILFGGWSYMRKPVLFLPGPMQVPDQIRSAGDRDRKSVV